MHVHGLGAAIPTTIAMCMELVEQSGGRLAASCTTSTELLVDLPAEELTALAGFEFGNEILNTGVEPARWAEDANLLASRIRHTFKTAGLLPPPLIGPDHYSLQGYDSVMTSLEKDTLTRAFRQFDTEGKGFITEADLQRVLRGFGSEVEATELHGILEAAAGYDREARRVTYGNYVRTMSHTVKQTLDAGARIFRQGDPATHFYLVLSGEVALVREAADGAEELHATIEAGDFFGENALLAGLQARSPVRKLSARCTRPC